MALAMMLPTVVSAQRGIPRSNNVSVSSTVVKNSVKEARTYNAKVGFQQMVGVNCGAYEFEDLSFGLYYVGGYRFNDVLFLGGGVECNTDFDDFMEEYYIPIYAQVRTYFTKRIWRPYVSLSLGGYYTNREWVYDSGYEYFREGGGFYGDFTVGVDARITEKLNLYLGLGVNNMGVFFKTGLSF